MNELLEHQFLTFTLKEELYAIPVARVREVLEYNRITALPCTESYLKGLIDVRGRGIPVLDLRLRLGLGETPITKATSIIVVDQGLSVEGAALVGLLADSVHEVVNIEDDRIDAAPSIGIGSARVFLRGVGRVDERFAFILDLAKVFDEADVAVPEGAKGEVAKK